MAFLQDNGAAVRFDWDPAEFQVWQKKTTEHEACDGEALAKILVNDPPYATRLQLSEAYKEIAPSLLPAGVDSVVAVPVYGTRERYDATVKDLMTTERMTLELILDHLPMPAENISLSDIVELRSQPQFRESIYHLRKWQTKTVGELLEGKDTERAVRAAARDLERYVTQYREAMYDAKFKKVQTGVVSILAVGALLAAGTGPLIAALSALAPPLFSLRELVKPCWKELGEKEYAPAGVIYAASQL